MLALPQTAYLHLHMRQNPPYAAGAHLLLQLRDESHQTEEVFRPKMTSSRRHLLERIRRCHTRPPDRHMPKPTSFVAKEDAILTPRILVGDQLKLTPAHWVERVGHPNGSNRTVPITCSGWLTRMPSATG
jgi:hypothetical protein